MLGRGMEQPSSHIALMDPSLTMAEVLRRWPCTGPALMARGLPCMGCAMARFQTLSEAAKTHDMGEAELRRLLTEAIKS